MKRFFQLLIISIFPLIFSCNKLSDIGMGVLPEDDKLIAYITDTSSIEVYTLSMDSVLSSNAGRLLLGEYNDPIYGYTKASFVTEFSLAEASFLNNNYTIDSAVLTLTLDTVSTKHYGNTLTAQNIRVYELENALIDTSYYSNKDTTEFTSGNIIGTKNVIVTGTTKTINIKLSNAYAELFQDIPVSASNDELKEVIKGIYVNSDSEGNDGAIMKTDINSNSVITVYAHEGTSSQKTFKVTMNHSGNIRFNLFQHDYSSATFNAGINDELSEQDSVAYIQSMGGLMAKIKIPFLENLKSLGNIAVFRAELIVNLCPSDLSEEEEFPAIDRMLITGYDPENIYYMLPEYYTTTGYSGATLTDGQYRFELAGYIRDVIDGRIDNNGLLLLAYSGSTNYNRSVITTGKHSNRMKLYITYTKL
jgi:hypothetical protein